MRTRFEYQDPWSRALFFNHRWRVLESHIQVLKLNL